METSETTVTTKTYDLNPEDVANAINFAFANGFPVPLLGPGDTIFVAQQEFRPGHPVRVVVTHTTATAGSSG